MTIPTLLPIQYQRQNAEPIDVDSVFQTTAERIDYLTNPRRYAGQVVSDLQDGLVYVLDAAGTAWLPMGGGGAPGGSDTEVQFNDGGDFAGNSGFTYDKVTNTVGLSNISNATSINVKIDDGSPPSWYALYGDLGIDTTTEFSGAVAYDSSNNVYIIVSDDTGKAILVKYNAYGSLQWQKQITDNTEYIAGESLAIDSNDNIIVLSINWDTSSIILIKFNSAGSLTWETELNDSISGSENLTDVRTDSSDNIYINGYLNDEPFIIKLNSSGTIQWTSTILLAGSGTQSIFVDSASNVYQLISSGTVPRTTTVVKYNSSGTIVWQQVFSSVGINVNGYFGGIAVDSLGNIYFSGITDATNPNSGFLIKTDSSGVLQWQRTFYGEISSVFGLAIDSSDNVYVSGSTNYTINNIDSYVIKFDSSGNTLWQRLMGDATSVEDQWYSYGSKVLAVKGNVFSLTGYSNSPSLGDYNAIVIQLLTDGTGTGTYGNFTYSASSFTIDSVITFSQATDTLIPGTTTYSQSSISLTIDNASKTSNTVVMISPPNWYYNDDGTTAFPEYTFPAADGTCGQVLQTDGAGTMAWATPTTVSKATPTTLGTLYGSDIYCTSSPYRRNTSLGYCALGNYELGYDNVAIGASALQNGYGISNIAIGQFSLYGTQNANYNIAIGRNALSDNVCGWNSIAIGDSALERSLCGNNIAIGKNAGFSITSGTRNIAFGIRANEYSNTGCDNITLGYYGSRENICGNRNVAIGSQAAYYNRCGNDNIAIGHNANYDNRCGSNNIAIGVCSMACGTSGSKSSNKDIAIGNCALKNYSCMGCRIAIGDSALCAYSYNDDFAIGHFAAAAGSPGLTMAVGNSALKCGTTCFGNMAIGLVTMYGCTRGGYNMAVGSYAMYCGSSGSFNTAVGLNVMLTGPLFGSDWNVGVGYSSLSGLKTGCNNTAVGSYSADNLCNGSNNTALGYGSLGLVTGCDNISIGACSGRCLTTGNNNTIIGKLPGSAGLECTVLIGAGTCERIKVDNTGLYTNNVRSLYDLFTSLSGATGVVTHDVSTGTIFRHTTIAANFTANITNLNLGSGQTANIVLILIQGATPYIATALQIGGVAQTINWQGGSVPSGNANKKDLLTFSIANVSGTYEVYGQLVSFG